LINIVSGGVTQVFTAGVPTAASLAVALMLQNESAEELQRRQELRIVVTSRSTDKIVAEAAVGWDKKEDYDFAQPLPYVPIALPLTHVAWPELGSYDISVSLDDEPLVTLSFTLLDLKGSQFEDMLYDRNSSET
jgi:hypothetical protein